MKHRSKNLACLVPSSILRVLLRMYKFSFVHLFVIFVIYYFCSGLLSNGLFFKLRLLGFHRLRGRVFMGQQIYRDLEIDFFIYLSASSNLVLLVYT